MTGTMRRLTAGGIAESPDLGVLNQLSRNKRVAWRWDGVSLEQPPADESVMDL